MAKLHITHKARIASLALCLLGANGLAHAQNSGDWRLRLGPGHVSFDEQVTLSAAGNVVPGAGATFSNNTTLLAELGYRFTPQWSAGLTFGIPPTTTATGSGTAAPFGDFGKIKYGPLGLSGQYQFNSGGTIQPYVGAGVAYNIVFSNKDRAITQLKAENSWGTFLQLGADIELTPKYGLFIDVKKFQLKTKATGFLPAAGGAPVRAEAKLNPLVIHAGLLMRF